MAIVKRLTRLASARVQGWGGVSGRCGGGVFDRFDEAVVAAIAVVGFGDGVEVEEIRA